MNRNNEAHFNQIPKTNISRSRFKRDQNVKFTFDAGKLIPFYVDEVLPGDTFSVNTAGLVRMTTPVFPVMDNSYLDVYYFFVPNRIVWEHWKEFMGENTTGAWEHKILIVLSDGKPNDVKVTKTSSVAFNRDADYKGIKAVKDTAHEVRKARTTVS